MMNSRRYLRSSISQMIASALALTSMTAFAGNTVTGTYAVVSGGDQNTASAQYSAVGGGEYNQSTQGWAVVGGGSQNYAAGEESTVAGGGENYASALFATIGGGGTNGAYGQSSTISGGGVNSTYGQYSSIPGGVGNQAGGDYSFAAGNQAHVRNSSEVGGSNTTGDQGTFTWADSYQVSQNESGPACPNYPVQPTCTIVAVPTYASTGPNEFLVRANGGFALNDVPINSRVAMTIEATAANPGYADVFLHQANLETGILLGVGDATSASNNDAAFYVDQYNGSSQKRRMSIDGGGNVTVSAQAYKPGGGSWAASSDGRLKKNVQPLSHALDRLLALRGVTFEYAQPDANMHPAGTFTGFIAQEVQPAFPSWIGHDAQGYLTVGPQGFEALTVEALRQIKNEDDTRIAKLESDNAQLRERIAQQLETQQHAVVELQRQVAVLTKALDGQSAVVAGSSTEGFGH
jgi:hypothetical protein